MSEPLRSHFHLVLNDKVSLCGDVVRIGVSVPVGVNVCQ